jgi:predicted nucleotidyltransferase component of viral defense system
MDSILRLTQRERTELFAAAAQKSGLGAVVLEKDFWVCWILKELFGLPVIGQHLIFKGGTSLSKVFKIINRFSEDIDVSIDRSWLGFGGANEPEAGASNKEKQRRVEALMLACKKKIASELLPALHYVIQAKVGSGEKWSLRTDEADPDQQTLLFDYPSSLPLTEFGYIRRVVKIEMGARADHWPCETKSIAPYVTEHFPEAFKHPSCDLKVLAVERTFWEKATILHAEYYRPLTSVPQDRLSRHHYDFFELIRKGVAARATKQLDLLHRVAQHKSLFFKSAWAKYGEATKGTLRIAPPELRFDALRQDYGKMQEMFFGEAPAFGAIIAALKQWESEFNGKIWG